MLQDADAVSAALAGTVLAGRPVVEVPMVVTDDVAFAVECGPHEVVAAWEAARGALAATGRWPLVVWFVDARAGWLDRLAAERAEARRGLAEMRYATGDHSLGRPDFPATIPPVAVALAERLAAMAREPGDIDGPLRDEVRAALGDHPTRLALERWLLDRETGAPPSRHLEWFDPGGPCGVFLLPVASGWDTLVHFGLAPAGGELGSEERLIAVVRSWHERYGAELVANWGTMLQFVVTRPPETIEEAWQVAVEQEAVAPSTVRAPGVPLRHHARALLGRRQWFLHNRP